MGKFSAYLIISLVVISLISSLYIRAEEETQLKLGTFVTIKLKGPFWLDFKGAFNKAFASIDEVDMIASRYNKDSQLSRLNQAARTKPVITDDELFFLIKESIELSKASDGAFDITVAPLVELWKACAAKNRLPAEEEVSNALAKVGYQNIILDEPTKSIFFLKKGVSIDLSAIAKGYAVDMATQEIKRCGFKTAVVNAGGDIYCLGRKNFFRRWDIGIADPADKDRIVNRLRISDKAVATSGGYQQYFHCGNKDYSHIIDPRTGYPVTRGKVFSVTVIAQSCALADGIATAVSVGGQPLSAKLKRLYPGIEIIEFGGVS